MTSKEAQEQSDQQKVINIYTTTRGTWYVEVKRGRQMLMESKHCNSAEEATDYALSISLG